MSRKNWMKRLFEEDVFSFRFPVAPPFAMCFADEGDDGGGDPPADNGDDGDGEGDAGGNAPDASELQAKLAQEIQGRKKERKQRQELQRSVEELEKRVLSDDDLELFGQLRTEREEAEAEEAKQEQEALEKKGEFDQLLKQKEEKYEADLAAERAKAERLTRALQRSEVQVPIQAALAAHGVTDTPTALYVLQGLHEHQAVAEIGEDGAVAVKVVDRQDNAVTDAECEPGQTISIEQLVEGFISTPAGQRFLPPSGDEGTGTHKGGGTGKTDAATLAELDRDHAKKSQYIQEHGMEAYLQLASDVGKANKQRLKQKQRAEAEGR